MKFLAVDPGEDTGWSVWNGRSLVDAGTTKMWDFSDAVWNVAMLTLNPMFPYEPIVEELEEAMADSALIVCEDWRLYPWVMQTGAMNFDECRTARLIGSLYAVCRLTGWDWEVQPAKIKEPAEAAGAESFFTHPLNENRHANDSCRHGWYYITAHGVQ